MKIQDILDNSGTKLSMIVMSNLSDMPLLSQDKIYSSTEFCKWVIMISNGDLNLRVNVHRLIDMYNNYKNQ